MATIRMMPPGGGRTTIAVNGRTYTCAVGSAIDVPDFDAFVMLSNDWVKAGDAVGATAGRPSNPNKGQQFHDTTLGYNIVWDGKAWRNPATGASV
jgi:hypothetical protein